METEEEAEGDAETEVEAEAGMEAEAEDMVTRVDTADTRTGADTAAACHLNMGYLSRLGNLNAPKETKLNSPQKGADSSRTICLAPSATKVRESAS